ncbi:hypothetical protein [Zoogloea sp.]|uniref:general secretion pathway protein GspK n=1 Tax=Zoogloea sp. TaxID=49181 RepID=UPI0014159321|nr:MAG: general secretion pathway protein GspK [Zoogloea sp.]
MDPRMRVRGASRQRQQGYALVAVMWMVSALMILVSALAFQARTEIRVVSAGRDALTAATHGDAAIQLVLAAMAADPRTFISRRSVDVEFEGKVIRVVVTPLNGLVSLNGAPAPLLEALLVHAAGLDPALAGVLAERIVDWRDVDSEPMPRGAEAPDYLAAGSPYRPRNGPFEAPEDLLQVLGVDLETYDKIRDLITVDGGSSLINPLAAPQEVLLVLARGNAAVAGRVATVRDAGQVQLDTTSLMQEFTDQSSSLRFRLQALVPTGDGREIVRTQVVDASPTSSPRLPWRVIRVERPYGIGDISGASR